MRKASLVALAGTASLLFMGLGATAASASPAPAACHASNLALSFSGPTGTVNEGYNAQHPSFPNTETFYKITVHNKGAACTLAKADPIVTLASPSSYVSTPVGSPQVNVMAKGDTDSFYLGVQNPNNYQTSEVVRTYVPAVIGHRSEGRHCVAGAPHSWWDA